MVAPHVHFEEGPGDVEKMRPLYDAIHTPEIYITITGDGYCVAGRRPDESIDGSMMAAIGEEFLATQRLPEVYRTVKAGRSNDLALRGPGSGKDAVLFCVECDAPTGGSLPDLHGTVPKIAARCQIATIRRPGHRTNKTRMAAIGDKQFSTIAGPDAHNTSRIARSQQTAIGRPGEGQDTMGEVMDGR